MRHIVQYSNKGLSEECCKRGKHFVPYLIQIRGNHFKCLITSFYCTGQQIKNAGSASSITKLPSGSKTFSNSHSRPSPISSTNGSMAVFNFSKLSISGWKSIFLNQFCRLSFIWSKWISVCLPIPQSCFQSVQPQTYRWETPYHLHRCCPAWTGYSVHQYLLMILCFLCRRRGPVKALRIVLLHLDSLCKSTCSGQCRKNCPT